MNKLQEQKIHKLIRRIINEEVSIEEISNKLSSAFPKLKIFRYNGETEDRTQYTSFNFMSNKLIFGDEGITIYTRDIQKGKLDPIVVIDYEQLSDVNLEAKTLQFMKLLLKAFSPSEFVYYTNKYEKGVNKETPIELEFKSYIG